MNTLITNTNKSTKKDNRGRPKKSKTVDQIWKELIEISEIDDLANLIKDIAKIDNEAINKLIKNFIKKSKLSSQSATTIAEILKSKNA